jgi:protein-S-isoprenylcysteine O-methyltransferase Ste14
MWLIRLYLLAGLLLHKAIWEILKCRTGAQQKPPTSFKLRLVKAAKVSFLLAIIVQTLVPTDLFPIAKGAMTLRIAGIVIYTAGLILAVIGRLQLGANWSDIEDAQVADRQVVVSRGLYRYIRHPIYVGDLLLLLGLELALNSWLVLGLLALVPVVLRRAVLEERVLAERLPGYHAYARRTKRFIPFIA